MSGLISKAPIVAIRTYQWDTQNELLARFYKQAGLNVVVVMDETKRPIDCGRWPKVSITREWIEKKGLYDAENIMWKSGDYCFYALREAFPNIKGFWLIEDEAVATAHNLVSFLESFEKTGSDFMAGVFNKQNKNSRLYNTINYKTTRPSGCSFGVTYMSGVLADYLLKERVKLTQLFKDNPVEFPYQRWATDEVFVMNYSLMPDFKLTCLTDIDPLCMTDTYFFNGRHKIMKAKDYHSLPIQGRFYHPVIIIGTFDPLVQIRHARLCIKHKNYHEAMSVYGRIVRRIDVLQRNILGLTDV